MVEITFCKTRPEEEQFLKEWLFDPEILCWFPMKEEPEVADAVKLWMNYAKIGSSLTAFAQGEPCAMAMLYLQPYVKQRHTCLFSIIVKKQWRGQGVGSALLDALMRMAKEEFHIEILHLEVYEGNPAEHLYRKLGFEPFGRQARFIKEEGRYNAKLMMQKRL